MSDYEWYILFTGCRGLGCMNILTKKFKEEKNWSDEQIDFYFNVFKRMINKVFENNCIFFDKPFPNIDDNIEDK